LTNLHKELVKILKEEKDLLTDLYKIVSEERDLIVGLKSSELERILTVKEATIMKLSLWEKEREKLLSEHELKGKSLSFILSINPEDNDSTEVLELRELYESMKTLLESISEIQKINEQLIDRSINYVGTALRFLESFGIFPKQSLSKEA